MKDPDVEAALAVLRARLPEGELRWVPPAQRHLTLRFFEDLPEGRVADVRDAAAAAAAASPGFWLELHGVGCFPTRGAAKVVWAGCSAGREALVALAGALSRELSGRGFPAEARPFAPHLTLARSRSPRGSRAAAAAVRPEASEVLGRVRVESLVLVRSTLGSGPPRHDVIATFPLAT